MMSSIFHSSNGRSFQLQHEGNVPVFVESATGKTFAVCMAGDGKLRVGDERQGGHLPDLPPDEIEAARRRAYGLAPPDSDEGEQADGEVITLANEPAPYIGDLPDSEVEAAVSRAYAQQ